HRLDHGDGGLGARHLSLGQARPADRRGHGLHLRPGADRDGDPEADPPPRADRGMTRFRAAFVVQALPLALALPSGGRAAPPSPAGDPSRAPTAREIIALIQAHVGVPWRSETVDTVKAGDPDTPITGVAVTMMATHDVLQRAAATGRNLVITHEPTFYGHL